jgi:hypothetical protein
MENRDENTPGPLVAQRCWVDGRRIYIEIDERRSISFPASKYDTLDLAPQTELEKVRLHADGEAITWDSIDEEILVEDVACHRFVHTSREDRSSFEGKDRN